MTVMQETQKIKYKYWKDGNDWVGHLLEFPDYLTQGHSLEDLKEHLSDLYRDLTRGSIPEVRRVDELDIR